MTMTTTENGLDQIRPSSPATRPGEIGQATSIEQARAVADVQATAYLARQFPRDISRARADMLDSCAQMALAERSAFSFRRGGQPVTGPSIHLARELARCWGNIQYGLVELSRDDIGGSSQMIAYAWDVQTNARASSTFIVPHTRDTKDGPRKLTETRDIYENNANQGARRVREMVFAVLPTWFVEEAKAACRQALEAGGGEPLAVRIDKMIAAFKQVPVTVAQLEARVGIPKAEWTVQEVATLGVVYTSLRNGETRKEDEFPPITAPVTPEEVAGQAQATTRAGNQQAAQDTDRDAVIDQIYALAAVRGLTDGDIEDDFAQRNDGVITASATVEQLRSYLAVLEAEKTS
jgi:hypothetical protein